MIHEILLEKYGAARADGSTSAVSLGTVDSYGLEQLRIIPGEGWEGLTITATFHPPGCAPVRVLVPEDGLLDVPREATASVGFSCKGRVVFAGVADGVQRISCDLVYAVKLHAPVEGPESAATPGLLEQVLAEVQKARQDPIDDAALAEAIAEYLEENPVETGATAAEAAQIRQNAESIDTLKQEKLDTNKLPEAVNDALAQAKASGEFDGKDGKDGVDGKDGYTPQKGIDYFDGKDGSDGVSATHSWNGTVLTVTSASGTSTADLKGADGKSGVYILAEEETIADAPADANVVIDPAGTPDIDLSGYAKTEDVPTDTHINDLINTALGVIENGAY